MKLAVRATADADIFSVDASGLLELNTTNTSRLGVDAHTFLLDLNGKVEILKVLKFSAQLRIVVTGSSWSFLASASLDFFGIATLSGSVYLTSDGQFDIQLSGGMSIGSSSFGISGSFHFRVRSTVDRDNSGNAIYTFELSGGASVNAHIFGISLGVGLDFSFYAHGAGRTKIELAVTVSIDLGLFSISATAHFTIGYLELPKPVYMAGEQNSAQDWYAPNTGTHDLYLNVGDRAGSRNISTTEPNESYTIEQLLGTDTDATIKVTAFGRSNTYQHVSAIYGSFGAGADFLDVKSNVKIPVYIHGGADDDALLYAGSNALTQIYGDDGNDYLEATGPSNIYLDGGNGNDMIVHTPTTTTAVATINGGSGDDRLYGGTHSDVIHGNDGNDFIYGPAAAMYGDNNDDTITVVLDTADPVVLEGGSGNDTLNVVMTSQNDTVDVAKVASLQLNITTDGTVRHANGFENLSLDGRGGGDAFVVHDLQNAGLSTFTIDLGHTISVNGTKSIAQTVNGVTYNRFVPDITDAADGSADSVLIEGSSIDDRFIISAAGPDVNSKQYTQIKIVRSTNVASPVQLYAITILHSVRGEHDSLTIDAKDGNDMLDASGLGASIPANGVGPTDQTQLTLIGGAGNDRLIGTPFDDVLNTGTGR